MPEVPQQSIFSLQALGRLHQQKQNTITTSEGLLQPCSSSQLNTSSLSLKTTWSFSGSQHPPKGNS